MLNDLVVRKLAAPASGVAQFPDGKIPGFGVRVTASGVRSFYLAYRYKGRTRRMSLGRYPFTPLSAARTKAHDAVAQLGKGIDPQRERAQRRDTFAAALDDFIDGYCKQHNRPSTAAETEKLLRFYFLPALSRRALRDLEKSDMTDVLDGIVERGKMSAARHAFAAIRKFMNWCVEEGLIEQSPCAGLKAPGKHKSRDRVLDEDEIARFWRATSKCDDTADIVMRLLLLTGQRCGEVCGMAWDEIDDKHALWTIPGDRTKNHKPHTVPLTPSTLALIASVPRTTSPLVFPARGKPEQPYAGYAKRKKALDAAAKLSGWTIHDLRRTAATGLARLGAEPHVVERILNHASGTFAGVAGVYNRFKYVEEMRSALRLWDDYLRSIEGEKRLDGQGR